MTDARNDEYACSEDGCHRLAAHLLLGPLRPNVSVCIHGHRFTLAELFPRAPETCTCSPGDGSTTCPFEDDCYAKWHARRAHNKGAQEPRVVSPGVAGGAYHCVPHRGVPQGDVARRCRNEGGVMSAENDHDAPPEEPRFVDAKQLTVVLEVLLEDAFAIEGAAVEVRRISARQLLLRAYGKRFVLTAVKKR